MNIANESPSSILRVFKNKRPYSWLDGANGIEGDIGPYHVAVRWDWLGNEPPDGCSYAMIQVAREDGGSVFDWRDLQQIKNLVVGQHWEAIELYPDEDRLKDPSNARYLWCKNKRFQFGLRGGRVVFDSHEAIAPQRPFPRESEHQ